MKKLFSITNNIEIWADENCFAVRFKKSNGQYKNDNWYLATISQCFQEVFEHLIKEKMMKGKAKTLEEAIKVIKAIKKELDLRFKLSLKAPRGDRSNENTK